MFSSEQKFNVNGSDKEELKEVLALAFRMADFPTHYSYSPTGVQLYWEYDKETAFPEKASIDTVVSIIWDRLNASDVQTEFRKITKEKNIDGGVEVGWEVKIPSYSWNGPFLEVDLDWIYYAK